MCVSIGIRNVEFAMVLVKNRTKSKIHFGTLKIKQINSKEFLVKYFCFRQVYFLFTNCD